MSKEYPTIDCALDGCTETFEKRVHNQRFHSRECCRVYTNARILEQYHEKKNRKLTGRTCRRDGCDTVLSRYNEEDYCASCYSKTWQDRVDMHWEINEEDQIII